MKKFNSNGYYKIDSETTYSALTIKKNKLFLMKETRVGIYYNDIKLTKVSRVIDKNGFIRLDGEKVYVLDIIGVAFHLNEYQKKEK